MPILDKADYLFIPSGIKTSKIYSVKPTNGDFDHTFSRSGNAWRVNQGGLIESKGTNEPRLNYLGGGCPSFLCEGSRTNYLKYSEQLDNSAWSKTYVTITANQGTAPDGEYTADKASRTSTSANYFYQGITKPSASIIQMATSAFVKSTGDDWVAMRVQGTYPNRIDLRFQFSTQTIETYTAGSYFLVIRSNVTDYGNGWYRIELTYNTDTASTLTTYLSPRSTSGNIDGSDTSSSANCLIWGVQTERYMFPSSYIKTESTSFSRNYDDAYTSGYNVDLSDDVTLFFDFRTNTHDATFRYPFNMQNSSGRVFQFISYTSSGQFYHRIRLTCNGSYQYLVNYGQTDIAYFQRNKVAVRLYESSKYKVYVNGSLFTSGTLTNPIDVLGTSVLNDFGASTSTQTGDDIFAQAVFNTELTDNELIELTS